MTKNWKLLAMACAWSLSLTGGLKTEALAINDETKRGDAEADFLKAVRTGPADCGDSASKVPVVEAKPDGTDKTPDEARSIPLTIGDVHALPSKDAWDKYRQTGVDQHRVDLPERRPISLKVGETRSMTVRSRFSIDIPFNDDVHTSIDTIIKATHWVCHDPARDQCKPGNGLLKVVAITPRGTTVYENMFHIPKSMVEQKVKVVVTDRYYTAYNNNRYHLPFELELWITPTQ